jgi:hypothetical protein
MKTFNNIVGTLLLVVVAFTATAQNPLLENYLQNDCDNPTLEKALVENAEIWQQDLIRVAFNGPSQEQLTAQSAYLTKRYAILRDAAENKEYTWLTDEYRRELLSVTQEEFLTRELNSFTTKYKEQALRGLQLLRSNGVLEETVDMSVELFPNPAVENITIVATLGTESDYLLSVMDFNGAHVSNQITGKGATVNHEISVENLPVGEYFVQVVSSNGSIITKKFVVIQ